MNGNRIPAVLLVLGLSAAYELLEWQTAVWTGSSADAFLGTQGDPWDTQEDMAWPHGGDWRHRRAGDAVGGAWQAGEMSEE